MNSPLRWNAIGRLVPEACGGRAGRTLEAAVGASDPGAKGPRLGRGGGVVARAIWMIGTWMDANCGWRARRRMRTRRKGRRAEGWRDPDGFQAFVEQVRGLCELSYTSKSRDRDHIKALKVERRVWVVISSHA